MFAEAAASAMPSSVTTVKAAEGQPPAEAQKIELTVPVGGVGGLKALGAPTG